MSYDVYLTKRKDILEDEELYNPEFDDTVCCGNYTFNVFEMLSKAFHRDDWKYIHGKQARHALKDLHKAIQNMALYPDKYKAMNPENGWGSYDGALNWLTKIYSKCTEYPEYYIYISC